MDIEDEFDSAHKVDEKEVERKQKLLKEQIARVKLFISIVFIFIFLIHFHCLNKD